MSTTHSPRMMNDNNHAHTPISCDVPVHMKCNHAISCLCHVTHIYMDSIWTISFMHYTHASFGQLYQSTYNFQLNHTNHVNILIYTYILSTCQYIRTHILTSNQLLQSMSFKLKQCQPHPQDQLWHRDAHKTFHKTIHNRPQDSSELGSEN